MRIRMENMTEKVTRPVMWVISLLLLFSLDTFAKNKIKIACVGNSITYGAGIENRELNSYPAQLGALLGEDYEVRNFGKNGATLLSKGDSPYVLTNEYREALDFEPDLVFIKLGSNDSKPANRVFLAEFLEDYKRLIASFAQLPSRPRIVLLLPLPAFNAGNTGITADVIAGDILPRVRQVAFETGREVINLHNLFVDSPSLFPDAIHPSSLGATIIAQRIYEYINMESEPDFELMAKFPNDTGSFDFHGFQGYQFDFGGRDARVVIPKRTAVGRPWVWRARFWGHEPQLDIALLEHGFHVVYCDVSELFGNKEALFTWNRFYKRLTKAGLSKKSVMEGMSRGGFYCYRWAVKYPHRIAAVYADNPVLDSKSWPGGKGEAPGSPEDWERFKDAFRLKDEKAALAFKGNPIDLVKKIVKPGYPMMHVVGVDDTLVPIRENSDLFEAKVIALKGDIQVIRKTGAGHHPHSLKNPQPLVDFIIGVIFQSRVTKN